MRKGIATAALIIITIAMALPASAAKIRGTSTLKDSQPYNVKDKKDNKHQAYDLTFDTQDKEYTCRTDPKKSMNATDFVVGSQITYEIDKDKGKIKNPADKKVECKIVRVEMAPAAR